jgi:hypothetical protein
MARRSRRRVAKAIGDAMWKRDQLEMRAVDKLLSFVERPRPGKTARRRTAKRGR